MDIDNVKLESSDHFISLLPKFIKDKGTSIQKLALLVGLSRAAIYYWLDGRNKQITVKNFINICDTLGYEVYLKKKDL